MVVAVAARPAAEDEVAVTSYFEVHVRRDERWVIDCTAQSADDALAEAEEIAKRGDVQAVKVIKERYDARTDQSASRVVHAWARAQRKRSPGMPRAILAAPRPVPPPSSTPPPTVARPEWGPPPQAPAPWLLFVWASLVLAIAGALLFLLLLFAL